MKIYKHESEGKIYLYFNCPACHMTHMAVIPPWTWNGSIDSPTIRNSVLSHISQTKKCHLSITDGIISYYNDSFHNLAGKTIEMPNWDTVWFNDELDRTI